MAHPLERFIQMHGRRFEGEVMLLRSLTVRGGFVVNWIGQKISIRVTRTETGDLKVVERLINAHEKESIDAWRRGAKIDRCATSLPDGSYQIEERLLCRGLFLEDDGKPSKIVDYTPQPPPRFVAAPGVPAQLLTELKRVHSLLPNTR